MCIYQKTVPWSTYREPEKSYSEEIEEIFNWSLIAVSGPVLHVLSDT